MSLAVCRVLLKRTRDLLTLFAVPSIYVLVARTHRRLEEPEAVGELEPVTG